MRVPQSFAAAICAAVLFQAASPAAAEVFYKPPQIPARVMTEPDPAFDPDLPGATEAERHALLVWSLRQGLLLGALQCHTQYPTLLATPNYNALLTNHAKELSAAFKALNGYFKRTEKTPKAAQDALDRFATKATSSYSTVKGQQTFCYTAGWVGRRALFTPRGMLGQLATEHLSELRESVKGGREQQFRIPIVHDEIPIGSLPPFDVKCWSKKDVFNTKKCGEGLAG